MKINLIIMVKYLNTKKYVSIKKPPLKGRISRQWGVNDK